MRHRVIIVCSALVLALIIVAAAPLLLRAQGPQAQQGQQGQPAVQGQGQQGQRGAGQGRGGGRGRGNQPDVPSKPTPRWPDGHPRLGAPPEEKGIWGACCGSLSNAQTPYQPWAKAVYDYRRNNEFEPHTRCKPSGGSRQFVTPYGTEIVEFPDLQQIVIFDIGGPHTFRKIYMDGKPHPANLVPTYYGDSRGHWEGDTLVVDNTGFNESFWMDRAGSPHTEKLHFIEKFTRSDYNTLKYEVTVDDPGAYTQTWTNSFQMRWTAGQELFEYVCQDNNFAPVLLIGNEEHVDRTSIIVP
jgi:hypothetical protein